MLRIDTVVRNTNLSQIKTRLEQAGISNFSTYHMDSDHKSPRPSFFVSRSKIEIICKNSDKDIILEAISGANPSDNGIIYVNQLTPLIQINAKNTK
jgi:nitrogen regulatory protein PII